MYVTSDAVHAILGLLTPTKLMANVESVAKEALLVQMDKEVYDLPWQMDSSLALSRR